MTGLEQLSGTRLDYVVVGAGPAGLQLGYFLERAQRRYVILERDSGVASFFRRLPRHRQLISFNKVRSLYGDPEIRLRWDWNSLLTDDYELEFRHYSDHLYPLADDMIRYLQDFAEKYGLKVALNSTVVRVSRDANGLFRVALAQGPVLTTRTLVVATGMNQPYVPPIPGIEMAEGYESVPLEPERYRAKRVLLIGKGNAAFELADTMIDTASLIHLASPRPVRLAWNTKHPGDVRAHAVRVLDMYQLKLLNSALDCTIVNMERRGDQIAVTVAYSHAAGECEVMLYDHVIRCTGFRFDDTIFDHGCRPALTLDGRFPELTPAWESTNVPRLYFAGTLMQSRDFKRASSAFIDGFRYNVRTLHRFMEERDFGICSPAVSLPCTAAGLASHVLRRVSRTSALWAQFGYLCDVLVVDGNGTATYHEELPRDYVHDSELGRQPHYYTISFEWGTWTGDVFAIERHPRGESADRSAFLHPVVRRFDGGKELRVHHILEDLFGTYGSPGESGVVISRQGHSLEAYHDAEHRRPIQEFFDEQLSAAAGSGQASNV